MSMIPLFGNDCNFSTNKESKYSVYDLQLASRSLLKIRGYDDIYEQWELDAIDCGVFIIEEELKRRERTKEQR